MWHWLGDAKKCLRCKIVEPPTHGRTPEKVPNMASDSIILPSSMEIVISKTLFDLCAHRLEELTALLSFAWRYCRSETAIFIGWLNSMRLRNFRRSLTGNTFTFFIQSRSLSFCYFSNKWKMFFAATRPCNFPRHYLITSCALWIVSIVYQHSAKKKTHLYLNKKIINFIVYEKKTYQ